MNDIDRFIDSLRRDPSAAPPPGLDPQTAAFVRAIVLAEREPDPDTAALNRIWARVLADVPGSEHPASPNPAPSTNGRDRGSRILFSSTRSPRHVMQRWRWVRGLAAIITAIFFAGVLILMAYPKLEHGPQPVFLDAHHKFVLERLFFDAWNKGNVDSLDAILTPEYVHHTPGLPDVTGIDAIKQMITDFRAALPGAQFTGITITAHEKDRVEVLLTGVAIQTEPMVLPNGLHLEPDRYSAVFTIRATAAFNNDGQITELWTQPDGVGLWLQLVALPVPSPYPPAIRESESAHIDTVLQLGKLLDSAETITESDLAPLIDPAQIAALRLDVPDSLPVGAERITARADLVAVQELFRDETAQPTPIWIEQITIYRFESDLIVEIWQFHHRTFTAAP